MCTEYVYKNRYVALKEHVPRNRYTQSIVTHSRNASCIHDNVQSARQVVAYRVAKMLGVHK